VLSAGDENRHRPEATAEACADDGWFRSGDIGCLNDDGLLFISDRLKDMIISGGENIYPAEIEQIILELEAVGSVTVVGVPDARWGESRPPTCSSAGATSSLGASSKPTWPGGWRATRCPRPSSRSTTCPAPPVLGGSRRPVRPVG
jgi:hypothetical protein